MQINKLLVLPVVIISFATAVVHQSVLRVTAAVPQEKQKAKESAKPSEPQLTTTSVADNKYGEGGTKETISDANTFVVTKEVWKDKDGKIREIHAFIPLPDGTVLEGWGFYTAANQSAPVAGYAFNPKDSGIYEVGKQKLRDRNFRTSEGVDRKVRGAICRRRDNLSAMEQS